ncbi:hypothetical protein [Caudoviricetes sp.]|nr:hypothetical protein [Caudoviricetes sp.]
MVTKDDIGGGIGGIFGAIMGATDEFSDDRDERSNWLYSLAKPGIGAAAGSALANIPDVLRDKTSKKAALQSLLQKMKLNAIAHAIGAAPVVAIGRITTEKAADKWRKNQKKNGDIYAS